MSVAGTYECVLNTPLGKKSGTLTVVPSADGERFTGTLASAALGTVELTDGRIDGDMLLCRMTLTQPARMEVDCEVIVDGDRLVGLVSTGMFGDMKLSGHRLA